MAACRSGSRPIGLLYLSAVCGGYTGQYSCVGDTVFGNPEWIGTDLMAQAVVAAPTTNGRISGLIQRRQSCRMSLIWNGAAWMAETMSRLH